MLYLPKHVQLAIFIVLSVLLVQPLTAQVSTGTISGSVTDPTGAAIASAAVTATNAATNIATSVKSNSSGLYTIPNLPAGVYQISVEAAGFANLVVSNVTLDVGEQEAVNFSLKVGSATEKIVVTSAPPEVDLVSSVTMPVVDQKTIVELPLNGRDWAALANLQPGVSGVRTQSVVSVSNQRANRGVGNQLTVSGARPQMNNYRIDGISINDYSNGGPGGVIGSNLGVDAIQEFSVITGNATADYGKTAGGIVNAVTRTGGNKLHGDVYEFFRNSALDARNEFDSPGTIAPLRRNQFGASAGGPIIRDRTFLFGDYEGLRWFNSTNASSQVPSPDARVGNMCVASGSNPCASHTLVPISAAVAPYIAFYPLPNSPVLPAANTTGASDTGTFLFADPFRTSENYFTVRADHKISSHDQLGATYFWDSGTLTAPDPFNEKLTGNIEKRQMAAISESHTFTERLINTLNFGYSRVVSDAPTTLNAIYAPESDVSLGFVPTLPVGLINIGGISNFTGGLHAVGEFVFHYNSYQVYDDLYWSHGRNNIKTGFAFERLQNNQLGTSNPNGQFNFTNFAGFLQNQPTGFNAPLGATTSPKDLRQSVIAGYVTDDYHLASSVTMSLGVRYEFATVPTETAGRLANLPTLTSSTPQLGSPYFSNPTKRDFEPRIGIAYSPFANSKTVFHAAFGIYTALPLNYLFEGLTIFSAPFFESGSVSSASALLGTFPKNAYPLLTPATFRYSYTPQQQKLGYMEQYAFNMQQQLSANVTMELGYQGSHGVHLAYREDDINTVQPIANLGGGNYEFPSLLNNINASTANPRLNTNVGQISAMLPIGTSNYNSLQASVTRRLQNRYQFQVSYTWSKSLDDGSSSTFGDSFANSVSSLPYFAKDDRYAVSDFNIGQNFVFNYLILLPDAPRLLGPGRHLLNAGTAGSTLLTVTGTGFVPSTVVQVNATARSTTYVSSTQMVATLSAADQATAGVLSVAAVNPTPGGGSSPTVNVGVNNPAPGAILVSPSLVSTGTTSSTAITVTGANFVPSTVVQVNGSARATTFISSTQLQSALTVADQATGGSLSINAFTPAPGGGLSSAASVAVNNPVLGTLTLSPNTVPAGLQNNTTINVTGTGFIPGTSIQVNGAARTTTYASSTQLTFALLASDAASTGRLSVTAVNPAPAASASPAALLTVASPTATPVITSTSPSSFIISNSSTSMYVYGTGLTNTSVVQWNGTNLTTSYLYTSIYTGFGYTTGYALYAQIPASLLTTAGTASVNVYSPTALTSTSNSVTISINNPPVPTVGSISPGAAPISTDTKVTLYGTGFTPSSVVSFKGNQLPTTYMSSSTLTVTVPGSSNLFPGNGNFTVFTPAPGGGTSNAQVFTSYVPFTSNSMVYNPVTGLLYLSVPSSVGAPFGNSVVSMDPATGALGTPIPVGSEPNKLALTSDGKYLWVGLDGASGVRRVDLTTNTAGLQFALNPGTSGSPTAQALAAMPGSSTSVIVLQGVNYYAGTLGIYDSGALRGTTGNVGYYSAYTLQVDSSRSEIYAGGNGLYTFTYGVSGVSAKVTNSNSNIALGSSSLDDMQLVNGQLYGDFGKVYDAEAGTLLGTFYQTGTTVAQGATFYDASLGKVFVLDNSSSYCCSGYTQVQIFNPNDYSASSTVIPINVPYSTTTPSGQYVYFNPHHMIRWGNNGLAFHTTSGVFSVQSNSVKDLSSTVADLQVSVAASGGTTTGTQATYTATVTNAGPSDATDVALAIQVPSTGVLASASATSGTCSTTTSGCSFGTLTNGATVTATISVLQTSAGTATLNAQVNGSTTDNTLSNNSGSASVTVTGSNYNLTPTLTSISPSAIRSGSADTTITVVGTNFAPGSTVLLGNTVLNTTYVSTTQLTAIVPASNLGTLGYSPVLVSVPAPGGGTSNSSPLTVYSVISLGVNHIAYDDYSRKLMAAVSTGSTTVAANSLVEITPETATVGTPIPLTAQPTKLMFSATGQTLWVALNNTQSLVRYDMLHGTADTVSIPNPSNYASYYGVPYASELAVQPGTENTLAVALGSYYYGTYIYDYDPSTKTLTSRSTGSYSYNSYTCARFLDASNLFANSDSSSLTNYTVTSTGLASTAGTSYTLNRFSCFKIANSKAFAWQGGVASLSSTGTATQIGSFTLPTTYNYGSGSTPVAPDMSLGQVFFAGNTTLSSYGSVDGLLSYDAGTYLLNAVLPLNIPAIEGTSQYSIVDLVRWGQDGVAALTSTGHIYLLRGPFVVPQLLNSNSPAVISSASTLTHGAGNVLLTITGSNFVPGVAVTWNGSYRTTTITDSTYLTVAIPASDLVGAGSATVTATNPGATASAPLTVTIQ